MLPISSEDGFHFANNIKNRSVCLEKLTMWEFIVFNCLKNI